MEIKFQVERRYDESELELIRNTFAENLPLLKIIRKLMIQLPFSEAEEVSLRNAVTPEVAKIIRKSVLPTINGDEPLSQMTDIWSTVTVSDKLPDVAFLHLKARELVYNYLDQQLNILSGLSKTEEISFKNFVALDGKDEENAYIDIVARNNILANVEHQILELHILSRMDKETKEDMLKRNETDSSK